MTNDTNAPASKEQAQELRAQFSEQSKAKEEAYRKLRSIRDKIKARTKRMKELKEQRDDLTKQVQEQKEERTKLNNVVKEQSKKAQGLSKDAAPTQRSDRRSRDQNDPIKIKKQIDDMEQKLEIEVMSFDKEKGMRKRLKELKNKYQKLKHLEEGMQEARQIRKSFSKVRKAADEQHKKVQELAQASQEKHEELAGLYEEIKKLREEEKPLADAYVKEKQSFEELKKELDIVMPQMRQERAKEEQHQKRMHEKKVQKKASEVKEKIKKGSKLSMDDILAFQASKE